MYRYRICRIKCFDILELSLALISMDPSKYSSSTVPLSKVILDLPPSCIEFVPWHKDVQSNGEWFVVGTYELQKEQFDETKSAGPQSRSGSLILFRLRNGKVYMPSLKNGSRPFLTSITEKW